MRILAGWFCATLAGCAVLALFLARGPDPDPPGALAAKKLAAALFMLAPALLLTFVPALCLRRVITAAFRPGAWPAITAGLVLGLIFWLFLEARLAEAPDRAEAGSAALLIWALAGIAGGYIWWRIERPAWRRRFAADTGTEQKKTE